MRENRFDITIEEFDAPGEKHEFSEEYKRTKELNMRAFAAKQHSRKLLQPLLIAAAAALIASTPFAINAATNGDFFSFVWGKAGHEDVAAHEETIYDAEKNTYYTVTYPQRDYVEIDPQTAEELIGAYVSYPNITKEIDGTTITVLSAVRDQDTAVIELTLEKEGGVDVLNYSELDNEAKGAWFSDQSTFYFDIGAGGNMYVDLNRSSSDKLYCYYYASATGGLSLKIYKYPCTLGEFYSYSQQGNYEECEKIAKEIETTSVSISCEDKLPDTVFTNSEGGMITISPISMCVDAGTGLGLTGDKAKDPFNVYYVCITFGDGSTYIVDEHNCEAHSCDVEIANYGYEVGSLGTEVYYIFNRLVDTDDVISINVNGVEYTR